MNAPGEYSLKLYTDRATVQAQTRAGNLYLCASGTLAASRRACRLSTGPALSGSVGQHGGAPLHHFRPDLRLNHVMACKLVLGNEGFEPSLLTQARQVDHSYRLAGLSRQPSYRRPTVLPS